jgi:hypothetical protein
MESTLKRPISQIINIRMIAFAAVMLALIGAPVYMYLDAVVHGGIKRTSDGIEVDLKAMSMFPFDQTNGALDDVPQKWRDLEGQKVVCYGEIWAPTQAGRYVDSFDLCYSIAKCCFNGPPQVQHFVHCKTLKDADVEYAPNLVKVKGTLHVKVIRDSGKVSGVYSMDVESVEPQ